MSIVKLQHLAAAAALALSASAHADLFTFDPTGTAGAGGDITGAALIDWAPGSALAAGVNSSTGLVAGTNFTTYYQANLTAVQDAATGNLFTNGTGGKYFTAVAAFGETITTCTGGPPCTNATFSFNASTPNYFQIYATTSLANNLTGAGFTSGGTQILSAHVIGTGFSSNFAVSAAPTAGTLCNGSVGSPSANCLDQSPNGNQWTTTSTVTGSGGSKIQVVIDSVNVNYFPDLTVGSILTLGFFNTSQITPFDQVDPSQCLYNGVADCGQASNIGTINGAKIGSGGGTDVIFQADANTSFRRTPAVPEPASLALVGLGLLGAVGFGRRRRQA